MLDAVVHPSRVLVLAALIPAAVVLSACVGGADRHSSQSDPGGGFDILRRADPCGFVSPDTFSGIAVDVPGTARPEVDIEPDDFLSCKVVVDLPGDSRFVKLYIHIEAKGRDKDPPTMPTRTVTHDGDISIARSPRTAGSDYSTRVRANDAYSVQVWSSPHTSAADSADIDRAGERTVAAVVAQLRSGSLPALEFPPDSVGAMDLCSALTAPEVEAVSGDSGITTAQQPHSCVWQSRPSGRRAGDDVTLEARLDTEGLDRLPAETIAGRITHTYPNDNDGFPWCRLTTTIKVWSPWPGHRSSLPYVSEPGPLYENVTLTAQVEHGGPDRACHIARELATRAWPHLPSAH
ncbi:hypothetical protein [Nocardia sp. CDC153]|uniref:hypothetical protein n=1 Tax=Nocardia sp. CDC153 TaxID=3112167 RepID=UPI002DBFA54A|nr:hypothetical protein [Nocardia sp. CDC153]